MPLGRIIRGIVVMVIAGGLIAVVLPRSCGNRSIPGTVTVSGVTVTYTAKPAVGSHGMQERGEVSINGGFVCGNLWGCPPYVCPVAGSNYILLSQHDLPSSKLIAVNVKTLASFAVDFAPVQFGCGWGESAALVKGNIVLTTTAKNVDFFGTAVLDPAAHSLVPPGAIKAPAPAAGGG